MQLLRFNLKIIKTCEYAFLYFLEYVLDYKREKQMLSVNVDLFGLHEF